MLKKFVITVLGLIITSYVSIYSAEKNEQHTSFGIIGNYHYNFFSADLRALPDIPNAIPVVADGKSLGFSFGALVELPVTKVLYIQFRAFYNSYEGKVSNEMGRTLQLDGNSVNGTVKNTVTAALDDIRLEPLLKINFFDNFSFLGGFYLGYRINNNYSFISEVTSPKGALQENGSGIMDRTDKNIFGAGLQAAFTGGLCYDIPLTQSRAWTLSLETLYSYGLADVAKNFTWDANSLRAGISLRWTPEMQEPVIREQVEPEMKDTVIEIKEETVEITPVKEPVVDVNAYSPDEPYRVMDNIKMEEFLTTNTLPMLNYVFFDENSAKIPPRYNILTPGEVSAFRSDSSIYGSAMDTYHNVLNIIGIRMAAGSSGKITVTGCNSGTGSEENNLALSRERAEAVKNYLVDVWGIAPSRINTTARGLPENPSNNIVEDGIAENRRVEIRSDVAALISPVVINDTSLIISPGSIIIRSDANNMVKVKEWSLQFMYNGNIIKEINGNGDFPKEINIQPKGLGLKDYDDGRILYVMTVTDSNDRQLRTPVKMIKLDRVTIKDKLKASTEDKHIDRYSLILFDFDKYQINEANRRIIDFIKSRLHDNSTVIVEGFTDYLGDENYNLQLSVNRAKAAAEALKSGSRDIPVTYEGFGESKPLYDNSLPEGRFFNRTVNVIVETPIER